MFRCRTSRRMILLVAVLMGMPPLVYAEEAAPRQCPICQAANNQAASYPQHAASTLVRGALNTMFGWTELLVRPASEVQGGSDLATGVGKGISYTLKRTGAGLGELVTFWMPRSKTAAAHPPTIDCPICRSASASAHPAPQNR